MRPSTFLTAFLALTLVQGALAAPAQVVMIRHAEKPESGSELSKRGWKRAYALVDFFRYEKKVTRYGPPAAIYAFGQAHSDSSVRGIQTVEPLAGHLRLRIRTKYTRDEYEAAATEILRARAYQGKMVLISWEHDSLNNFADALGVDDAPKWDGDDFDRAWVIDFSPRGQVTRFRDIPQRLLKHDSDE